MADHEDRDGRLRRWALTELPYYRPEEGWIEGPEWGFRGGTVTADGVSVETEGSVIYREPDGGWLEVVSRRPDDDEFVEYMNRARLNLVTASRRDDAEREGFGQASVDREIRWLEEAQSAPPARWAAVVLSVAGRPTIFSFTRFGQRWTAAGRAGDADLVITGRGDTLPMALVPIPGPGPVHFGFPLIRAPRARRFPADLTAPVVVDDVAGDARVDLIYRPGELSGTYAAAVVRLALDVPAHRSSVTGSFTGADLAATWDLTDNSTTHPDVLGTLTGTFAGQPISVSATFHLDDDYWIEHAAISGDIAGEAITAELEAVDGGLDDSGGAVRIQGSFAGTALTLYTSISGDMTLGIIRGEVAGEAIQLDATTAPGPAESVRIVGRYAGPAALLAIIVCTFLHFV